MKISELLTHSYLNRDEIERSDMCTCFHCFSKFRSNKIVLWTDSDDPKDDDPGAARSDDEGYRGKTAICPECDHDSVLGDVCGMELNEELLKKLKASWYRR